MTVPVRVSTMNTLYIRRTFLMSEDIGLRIRVDDNLRHEFIEICKARDTTAAQVLRAFMRAYVEEHGDRIRQPELFEERPASSFVMRKSLSAENN